MGRVVIGLLILWIVVILMLYGYVVAMAKQAPQQLFQMEDVR